MSNAMLLKFKKREKELLKRIEELEAKVKQLETKEEPDDINGLVELIENNNKSTENAKNSLIKKIKKMEENTLKEKVTNYIDDVDYTIETLTQQLSTTKELIDNIENISKRTGIYYSTYKLGDRRAHMLNLLVDVRTTKRMLEDAKYFVPRKCIVNPKHVDNPNTYTSIIEAFQHVTPKGHVYVYNSDMEQIGILANRRWTSERKYIAEDVIFSYLGIDFGTELYETILNSIEFKRLSMEASINNEEYLEFQYSKLFKNLNVKGKVYPFDIASLDKETAIDKIKEYD